MPLLEDTAAPEKHSRSRRWLAGLLILAGVLLALLGVLVVLPFFRPISFQMGRTCVLVLTAPDSTSSAWPPRLIIGSDPRAGSPPDTAPIPNGGTYRIEGRLEVRAVSWGGRAYGAVWFPGRRVQ